ncbi:hypothetical protein [Ferruginibacter sp.]
MKVIVELILFYLLYKFIFDFLVPIYHTTKQVKQKVNEMQQHMNEQAGRQQQANQYTSANRPSSPKPKSDDYIEFEEVK